MTPAADEFAEIARRLAEIKAERELWKKAAPEPAASEGTLGWVSFPPADEYCG